MDIVGLLFIFHLQFVISSVLPKSTYILSRDCRVPINSDPLLNYQNTKHLRIDDLTGGIVLYSHEGVIHSNNGTTQSLSNGSSSSGGNAIKPGLSAYSNYPRDFSCEVVVHTPVDNAKIMMRVDSFYIPSSSNDCVENYVYVFDSNTAKSKAMPEAGGERGLCRSFYPRQPIFTTKSYICIAFHTSQYWPTVSSNLSPGFRLVLTAIRETTTTTCQPGGFYCGPRTPLLSSSHPGSAPHSVILLPPSSLLKGTLPLLYPTDYTGGRGGGLQVAEADPPRQSIPSAVVAGPSGKQQYRSDQHVVSHISGFCVSQQTVCDGVINCADGRDEFPSKCRSGDQKNVEATSASPKLLTVNSVSIAIAVCTIIIFTVCIGSIICCCHRCCHRYRPGLSSTSWRGSGNPSGRRLTVTSLRHQTDAHRAQPFYQSGVQPMSTAWPQPGPQSWNTSGNPVGYLSDRDHTKGDARNQIPGWQSFPAAAYPTGYAPTSAAGGLVNYGQLDPTGHFFYPLGCKQTMGIAKASSLTDYDSHQVGLDLPPGASAGGGGLTISASESLVSSEHYSGLRGVGAGATCPYTCYPPLPPGPPPALLMGGSPTLAMRRDPLGLEMCCYTPPPYGGCTVPPASSVTASSSSRTGTTSGRNGRADWPGGTTRGPLAGPTQSTIVQEASGGTMSQAMLFPCHRHHRHHRHSQTLSGSAQSALHTNTPVETISQTGVNDLTANGGILYLGEVFHPENSSVSTSYSDQPNPLRMPPLGAANSSSNTAATTPTTESGDGNSNRVRSHHHYRPHRLLLPSSSSTITTTTTQYCPVESRSLPVAVMAPHSGHSRGSARRHRRCHAQPHSRRSTSTTRPNSRHRYRTSSAGSLDPSVSSQSYGPGLVGEQNSCDRQEPVSFPVQL